MRTRARRSSTARGWPAIPAAQTSAKCTCSTPNFTTSCGPPVFTSRPARWASNITTRGVDLLDLPAGTLLHIGAGAVVEITGLRDPCRQLNRIQPGLMVATLHRDEQGELIRKAGVMAIVRMCGHVKPGDSIRVELPP